MKKKVFYSWLSDLPNNTNRSFLQKNLEDAIKNISNEQLDLDPVLDRDTVGIGGTPEIVSTIFSKIDNSHVFVADISIINQDAKERKTPNPNVLIELGYAARILGWDHVITIFNTDTGCVEDLPFDVRSRRPIQYSGKNKKEGKGALKNTLEIALRAILKLDTPTEAVRQHLKQKMDALYMEAYNNLFRLCLGYEHKYYAQLEWEMLDWSTKELQYHLHQKKILGFFLFKDYSYIAGQLEQLLYLPAFGNLFDITIQHRVITLIRRLQDLHAILSMPQLTVGHFGDFDGCRIVDGARYYPISNRNSYILKVQNPTQEGVLVEVDHGIMISTISSSFLRGLFVLPSQDFMFIISKIEELLNAMKSYHDISGIIVDPLTYNFYGLDKDEELD